MNECLNYLRLVKSPRKFFRGVAKEKIGTTIGKVAPLLIIFIVIHTILNYYYSKEAYAAYSALGITPLIMIPILIIMVLIIVPLSFLVSAALLHLGLKILRAKPRFSQTLKVLIYIQVIMYAVSMIYYLIYYLLRNQIAQIAFAIVFALVVITWDIALTAIGLSELYRISTGKAVGVQFLVAALVFGAFIAIMIVMFIAIMIVALIFKGVAG